MLKSEKCGTFHVWFLVLSIQPTSATTVNLFTSQTWQIVRHTQANSCSSILTQRVANESKVSGFFFSTRFAFSLDFTWKFTGTCFPLLCVWFPVLTVVNGMFIHFTLFVSLKWMASLTESKFSFQIRSICINLHRKFWVQFDPVERLTANSGDRGLCRLMFSSICGQAFHPIRVGSKVKL